MKIQILSDLHLGVQAMAHPHTDADLVILAGDIARPEAAIAWALEFRQPVLYVPGNHEFYGSSLPATLQRLRTLASGTHVHILDNDVFEWQGVRFLGTTLWTDFRVAGEGEVQQTAMALAQELVRDFSRIHRDDSPDSPVLTPQDTVEIYQRNLAWLAHELARPRPAPTVVITHHAPSIESIHPRFAGSLLNACFVSDAERLLQDGKIQLWVHGHTHDSFNYQAGVTSVLCNPRGYVRNGIPENPAFDPCLMVELG